jgi:hypothetical protein
MCKLTPRCSAALPSQDWHERLGGYQVAGKPNRPFLGQGLFSAAPPRGPRGWNNPAIVSSRVDSGDRTLPSKIDSLRKIDVRAEEITLPPFDDLEQMAREHDQAR